MTMPRNPESSLARRAFLQVVAVLASVAVAPPASSSQAPATAAQAAEQLIRRTVDAVFAVLRDPALAKDRRLRMTRLREVVDPVFDWATMAQSCLGHHWRKLGEGERAEFVRVFKELLAQRYMDDIDRFRGTEQVLVRGSEKLEAMVRVKTVLVTSSREQVPMDYMIEDQGAGLAVVDLSIEGVSLVNHYRTTFSRFLVNKPFSELLDQLKRKLGMS
jgi:phospholipid transport system substrate-binding protein